MRLMFGCLLALLVTACGRPQADLVIVSNSWLGSATVYSYTATREHGLPPHLKPIMLVSDMSVLRMLGNEAAIGAVMTLGNALEANTLTQGAYCLAMVVDRSVGGDAIVARADWQYQPGQRIRVGLEDSTAARAMLAQWLQHHHIDLSLVTTRAVLPTEQQVAFAEQEVDLIVTYEPFVQRLRAQQARVLMTSATTTTPVVDVVIIAKQHWSEVAPLLQDFIATTWSQTLTALTQRDLEFWIALQRLTQLREAELIVALQGIHFYDEQAQAQALEQVLTQDMPTVAQWLVDTDIFQDVVPLTRCGAP